ADGPILLGPRYDASATNPEGSKDPYILSLLTVPFNPCIPASASQAETLLST
ncbi:MAG: hypothetical protein EZS28_037152, partial [Streblomastix strix]